MKERILHLLEAERLSPAQLAIKLGVPRSSISHLLSERNKPGFDFIEKVLQLFPLLNPRWFILGEGTPYFMEDEQQGASTPEPTLFAAPANTEETKKVPNKTPNKIAPEINAITDVLAGNSGKKIEQIAIFYSDKTFKLYLEF